ncbi:starch synthase [Hasllibacter halocynthiae]|uniref:Glycogen synthase n=1 Tax=Hasllibacter halocynthiae TaxID=595589 RepID=A0A2T0X251_9RHOB|nr:starch synthase [Hasllibacter halocynthiae]
MKVLSVASECVPLVKTGGLADVVGALPRALAPHGVEMRTLLPGYGAVMDALEGAEPLEVDLPEGRVLGGRAAGLDLFVLDAPDLFAREGGAYLDPEGRDWPDNPERFAALSLAADAVGAIWGADVIHAHDWQAGLAPLFARRRGGPSVMTIHNVAFQGNAPMDRAGAMHLLPEDLSGEVAEYWGQISTLKAGIAVADAVTTVSPTYAAELATDDFGMGLAGLIRHRGADVHGILNGIDTEAWAPPYGDPAGKAAHRAALLAEFGLPDTDGPLCVVVSRLTLQKGLDLLLQALPALVDQGGALALLGTGDVAIEAGFREAASHPLVGVRIGYDEALSHRMMAGGDAILIPSRFEPCGLTQLYGLHHGTVPVVANVGGLADTVIDANDAALRADAATGIKLRDVTTHELARALHKTLALHRNKEVWTGIQRRGMAHPVGWDVSAAEYAALYRRISG